MIDLTWSLAWSATNSWFSVFAHEWESKVHKVNNIDTKYESSPLMYGLHSLWCLGWFHYVYQNNTKNTRDICQIDRD